MRRALRREGIHISRGRVTRLMKVVACQPKRKKAWKPCTTQANQAHPVLVNHLNREFQATAPHQKWMSDITYIPTGLSVLGSRDGPLFAQNRWLGDG